MAVFHGDGVGDVGERRRALVGRHDQVGVVAVAPDDAWPNYRLAIDDVVGDVEQAADEGLVAGDAFLLDFLARAIGRQPLGIETTLGARGHDDGVLHVLRLHEAQHFGAEILAAIGPAQAAARHVRHAQMHTFHTRAVHEDLELGPGQRQIGYGVRIEFERHPALGCAVRQGTAFHGLIVVRAQRGADRREIAAQDAVLVEALHLVQRAHDAGADALGGGFARFSRQRELRFEQPHQLPRDGRLRHQHALHVGLAERNAGLQQVAAIRAHHHDLAGGKPRAQQQSIEAVVLDFAAPGGQQRFLEQRL